MKTCANLFLFLFLLALPPAYPQELSMLDNVLAFTSQDDFIANNIYKVVSHNFSDDKSIALSIEGDINSYTYSLALVSMLPAFEKFSNDKSITFKYTNLTAENFSEAILMEAVKTIHPQSLSEYLLTRAECLFQREGMEVAEEMHLDIHKMEAFINSTSIIESIKNKFSTHSDEDYKVIVNDIRFKMIPAFYLALDEPSLYTINADDNDWGYLDCMSRSYVSNVTFLIDKGHLKPDDFTKQEFVFNQKDMYVSLVCCTSESKQSYLRQIKNYFLSPSDDLIGALSDFNYTTTSKYIHPGFFVNTCSKTPFKFYNKEVEAELERRENLIPKPYIFHNCSGNGSITFNPLKIRRKYDPYKFKWSNGQDKMNIFNLKPGFYAVTIKDAIGGQIVREYEVKNIRHPYTIEVVKSKFDPSTKNYNIDIQLSSPEDFKNPSSQTQQGLA